MKPSELIQVSIREIKRRCESGLPFGDLLISVMDGPLREHIPAVVQTIQADDSWTKFLKEHNTGTNRTRRYMYGHLCLSVWSHLQQVMFQYGYDEVMEHGLVIRVRYNPEIKKYVIYTYDTARESNASELYERDDYDLVWDVIEHLTKPFVV